MLITHDEHIADGFPRRIQMHDGEIVGDERAMSTAARRPRPTRHGAPGADAARLPPHELLGVALQGLRTRKLRAALSALGIAIGIGAMVAVVGVSASSQANLLARDRQRSGPTC